MGNVLSTERGSAGIEMVILSSMLLVFVLLPLICFIFEIYLYGIHSVRWMNSVENALDALEWELQTPALSQVERRLVVNAYEETLQAQLNPTLMESSGESYQIESLTLLAQDPPVLKLKLKVFYLPSTMLGAAVAQAGQLSFVIERERELPWDR